MKRFSETEFCRFWIEDGILYFVYKAIPYLDVEIARSIVSSRIIFQENEEYVVFCDTRGIKDSSKAARDYLAHEGSTLITAIAIYDDRNYGVFMLNYYILRNKPLVAMAVFKDRELALKFLEEHQ